MLNIVGKGSVLPDGQKTILFVWIIWIVIIETLYMSDFLARGQLTIYRIIYLNNKRFNYVLPVMPSISCFIKSICFWTLGSIFLLNNWQNKGFSETSLRASRVVFANSVHSSHQPQNRGHRVPQAVQKTKLRTGTYFIDIFTGHKFT